MKKLCSMTIMFFAITLLFGASARADMQLLQPADPPTDPAAVIRSINGAATVEEVQAAMDFYADDAVQIALPPPPDTNGVFVGKEIIQSFQEDFVTRNGSVEFADIQVQGDKVMWEALVVEDVFRELGVFPIRFSGTAVVQDGLVRSEMWIMDEQSVALLAEAEQRLANKAVLRTAYDEVFNEQNLDLLDETIAPDAVDHNFPELSGIDAFRIPMGGLLAAFPDLRVTSDLWMAEGDMVMARATFTGTHEGEFLGVPATGRQITWSHVDVNRVEDGQTVEAWHIGSGPAISQALETAQAEANRAVVERLYAEVFNQRNPAVTEAIFAADVVEHDSGDVGIDALLVGIEDVLTGLPDLVVTTDVWLVDGDLVTTRVTFSGTHDGEFLGVPPTGNPVEWTHIDIHRVQDGQITDVWHTVPIGAMLEQVGFELVPPAE